MNGNYPEAIIVKQVKHCAACGKDHEIEFRHLPIPEWVKGEQYTYSGICDSTAVVVFMRYIDQEVYT